MKQIFSNFVFSIFKYNDIDNIRNIVMEIFKEKINKNMAYLTINDFNIDNYIDSFEGNTLNDVFSFWKTSNYPDFVFFTSNSGDGRYTLCNVIHQKLECEYIQCTLRDGNKQIAPAYFFHYGNEKMKERDVLAYQDSKWVFYEKGTPLSFECIDYYKRHRINQRLNSDIIIRYLDNYGISFEKIDKDVENSFTFHSQFAK